MAGSWFTSKLGLVVVAILLLAGCAPPDNPGRRSEAVDLAERYLRALSGAEAGRGWSLLHQSARDEWGSQEEYVAAAADADWSQFEFTVLEAVYCDDGIFCSVALDVPNGRESLAEPFQSPDGQHSSGILFRSVEGLPGNAELMVVLPHWMRGPGGVRAGRRASAP
ncbi:MAG TPA: hypothetical protein VFV59_07220 [Candidatus Limnocylindria bacterium]|nr:hypothetical protein [Candidatus Limnocylindria bacterium]